MNQAVIYCRNKLIHGAYGHLLKPVFFRSDPEFVHDQMTKVGKWLGSHPFGRKFTGKLFGYKDPVLEQRIFNIHFENPIGLSAGFDKNAELTDILPAVGFGFAEVGSITGAPCAGNPKPRLWRLPKSKGLAVYYGLKNDGCEAIAEKLKWKTFAIPIGMSVAMTNCFANLNLLNAIKDYAKAFRVLEPLGSYITVNVSCPNTENGQPFLQPANFNRLFDVLDQIPTSKPVFIKLSPDLDEPHIDRLLQAAGSHRIHGIICTNLTKKRESSKIKDSAVPRVGGLSGKIVAELSDKMLAYIRKKQGNRFVLIGSGGVFNALDAYRKIRLGASLIQIITGMIYEGPQIISEINRGLAALLKRDGFASIRDAVGVDNC